MGNPNSSSVDILIIAAALYHYYPYLLLTRKQPLL